MVAQACDAIDINPAIFNRNPNGKPISGTYGDSAEEGFGIPPKIIFDGGPGFIRLYGIGAAGSRLLDQEATKIFSALFKIGFKGFDHKSGEMGIEATHFDSMYVVRTMVFARSPGACKKFIKAELTGEVAGAASNIFLRGLNGVARLLDNDLLDAGKAPKFESSLPHEVTFLEGKPLPIEIKPGVLGAAYKDILLSMPCKLNGPWVTGLLRSRGYGLVRPFNPTKAQQ